MRLGCGWNMAWCIWQEGHLHGAVQAVDRDAAPDNRRARRRVHVQHNDGVGIVMLNENTILRSRFAFLQL